MSAPRASGYEWWASLKHGGMLIAPSRLREFFPEDPEPLAWYMEARLRRDVTRLNGGPDAPADTAFLDTVLEGVLGLGRDRNPTTGCWLKANQVTPEWTRPAITGEAIRPRRVWLSATDGVALPVFTDRGSRLGIGRSRRQAARVVEWLRKADHKLALLTNGRQWRLIYAGLDHDAFAEWDTALWFEEGAPGPQVTALRALLSRQALEPAKEGEPGPLMAAIEASRKGQAELSSVLGERVRQAVELLIREHGEPLAALDESVEARNIYLAAVRIVMRMVVTLFAEARDLLPRDNPIYHGSYGLQGLREELDPIGGGSGAERLRHRQGAWARVLALFRLVHEGSPHERLPVLRYGGGLFEPGSTDAERPLLRALAVFEDRNHAPSDHTVYELLRLLTQSKVRVRQGRSATWVDAPVDFSDLSSEYIGILYEGLLDYELRRVDETDPVVFLNLGDQPALPVSRLETLDEKQVKSLVEKFKKKSSGPELSEDGVDVEDEEDEDAAAAPEESAEDMSAEGDEVAESGEGEEDDQAEEEDARREAQERAVAWGVAAVEVAKLVRKPRSRSADARAAREQEVKKAAERLIGRVVLPGEWYLVRYVGTRKGSGTFYTRPGLAVPTTQRTLRPLAYEPPLKDGAPDETAPPSDWSPRRPEEILRLKVCDPACGSGSFLVAALRFLTDALAESLHAHGRIAPQGEDTLVTLAEGEPGGEGMGEELLPCRPDAPDFDDRLRARLKRYVVERCLYGVDLDPLAVELGRLALWVETMDRELPFSFLDHKVKIGNSLVGCWFDRFRHYPALAFEREGGDKNHSNGVHFEKGEWTKAIKAFRNDRLKPALNDWIAGQRQLLDTIDGEAPEEIRDEAEAALDAIHALRPDEVEARQERYERELSRNTTLKHLREVFDTWCALWFWPPEALDHAPLPEGLGRLGEEAKEIVTTLRRAYRFFHWELEFPDVFDALGAGFDAVIGNPPWDTVQPASKEFFSNIDPLYRAYGKQEALRRQTELFGERSIEESWLRYNGYFKAFQNFAKHVGSPYGDAEKGGAGFSLGRGSKELHGAWRYRRTRETGYADPSHPFQTQGGGKSYTYKLFLEVGHAVLRDGGWLGLIVPSGLYTDKGARPLRELFVDRCSWRWLFGFENREGIFDIHRSFKFCSAIIEKGGRTEAILATFMQRSLEAWENAEDHVIEYSREQIVRFSPNTFAILELRNRRDLEILEKIYENAVLLGDQSDDGWKVKYRQGDFNMTSDSKLFPPRPKWEADGYRPDEYSRWLLGKWRPREPGSPAPPNEPRWELEPGVILSRDETEWIHEDEIENIALPLYEGRMVGQFDFSEKGWVSGKGRGAVWREIDWAAGKPIEPQFLMEAGTFCGLSDRPPPFKLGMMDVTSSTNARTMIATPLTDYPSGHKAPTLLLDNSNVIDVLALSAILNSFVYDFALRLRFGGLSLIWAVLEETSVPRKDGQLSERLASLAASLCVPSSIYAAEWLVLREKDQSTAGSASWRRNWALTPGERLRVRATLDALVAVMFGLGEADFRWMLSDCGYSPEYMAGTHNTRALNPKGFWRVGKGTDPHLRHPVLALAAFQALQHPPASSDSVGTGRPAIDDWDLPIALSLGDLGISSDLDLEADFKVRESFGSRWLESQEVDPGEESWRECSLHASNLGRDTGGRLSAKFGRSGSRYAVVTEAAEPKEIGDAGPIALRQTEFEL